MSKGLGAVQRAVLDKLGENTTDPMDDWNNDFASWTSIAALAGSTNRSKVESTRRAVLRLQQAGLVETLIVWREVNYWYGRWMRPGTTTRQLLVARLPLDAERGPRWQAEYDSRNKRAQEWLDRLVELDRRIG